MNEVLGIGWVIISFGVLYLLYQLGRLYKTMSDVEERYALFEIATLNRIANKKNINLDKEKSKLRTYKALAGKRSFKSELKREIINEIFKDSNPIEKQTRSKEGK
jgi:hypothetical protein